jgi:hypothetical protein
MNPYLDSVDTYYSIKHEVKTKKDYAGIGAVIFTFTVMSIVIGLSIFTAWQIANGYIDPYEYKYTNLSLYKEIKILNELERIELYCLDHYSTPFNNPVDDLIAMGQISQEVLDMFQGNNDCKVVKSIEDKQDHLVAQMILDTLD